MSERPHGKDDPTDVEEQEYSATRRTCLKLTGLAAVSAVGISTQFQDVSSAAPTMTGYTYDGSPLLSVENTQTPTAIQEVEPNDDRGDAMLLDSNVPVDATLADNEVDWYAVDIASGDDLIVEFERARTSGVTAVVLYGPDGEFLNQLYVGNSDPVSVSETASSDGVHYVEIVDVADGIDDYSIVVGDGSATPTPAPTTTATPTETETSSPTPTETTTAPPTTTETETSSPTPTPTPTETSSPTTTSTPSPTPIEDDYGQVGYGGYGYGGFVS